MRTEKLYILKGVTGVLFYLNAIAALILCVIACITAVCQQQTVTFILMGTGVFCYFVGYLVGQLNTAINSELDERMLDRMLKNSEV